MALVLPQVVFWHWNTRTHSLGVNVIVIVICQHSHLITHHSQLENHHETDLYYIPKTSLYSQ